MCSFKRRARLHYRAMQSHPKPYVALLIENRLIGRFGKEKVHINSYLLPGLDIHLDLSWKQVSFRFDNLPTPNLWK